MPDDPKPTEPLEAELAELQGGGIRVDGARLKKDGCTQFADPREYVREYTTNAADAAARIVRISGREEGDDRITIIISDDGHGMNAARVRDFLTIYRSVKEGDAPIGHHGIGKLSVAAIPGQCGFEMQTSTGTEAWRVRAGSLLEDAPIYVEPLVPIPSHGTTFLITFVKKESLADELRLLRDVLIKYVCFLPLEVLVDQVIDGAAVRGLPIWRDWMAAAGAAARTTTVHTRDGEFEVTLGFGETRHEIYQRRVFITSRCDLVSHDLAADQKLKLPGLLVRVDSPVFQLPFGRHCLRNEEVLGPLSITVRNELLPRLLADLARARENGLLVDFGVSERELERVAFTLAAHDTPAGRICRAMLLFSDTRGRRHSLASLAGWVGDGGRVYLESGVSGIDYGAFRDPVLLRSVADDGLRLLERALGAAFVVLGRQDTVLEAPRGVVGEIGPRERRLQANLAFRGQAGEASRSRISLRDRARMALALVSARNTKDTEALMSEAKEAHESLEELTWRVAYLVQSDGRTPCPTQAFLVNAGTEVVMNLFHLDVRRLVRLAERSAGLAGHLGLALALSDPGRQLLPDLSEETRQALIVADAIGKCTGEGDEDDDDEEGDEGPLSASGGRSIN